MQEFGTLGSGGFALTYLRADFTTGLIYLRGITKLITVVNGVGQQGTQHHFGRLYVLVIWAGILEPVELARQRARRRNDAVIDLGVFHLTFRGRHHLQEGYGDILILSGLGCGKAPASLADKQRIFSVDFGRAGQLVVITQSLALHGRGAIATHNGNLALHRRIDPGLVELSLDAHLDRLFDQVFQCLDTGFGIRVELLVVDIPPVCAQAADNAKQAGGIPTLAAQTPAADFVTLFLLE